MAFVSACEANSIAIILLRLLGGFVRTTADNRWFGQLYFSFLAETLILCFKFIYPPLFSVLKSSTCRINSSFRHSKLSCSAISCTALVALLGLTTSMDAGVYSACPALLAFFNVSRRIVVSYAA